jgi:hypothetical protein
LRYLTFEFSDAAEGVTTIEAMASTSAAHHAVVMDEVRQVLDWAASHFPDTRGPADDGMDWDDDLQVSLEGDGWHAVTLTLAASERFVKEFFAAFGPALE